MLWLGLTHSSRVVHVCMLYFVWHDVLSHSGDSHVRVTGPLSMHALARAHPTMSCIYLVLPYLGWAWASPTLAWLHCSRVCACLCACLLALSIYINSKKAWGSQSDMNHEQSTSLMVTTRMETTHGLTYSVSRAIEVTTWQSVNAICLAWLTVPVTGLRSLLATAMGATCSACQKRWLLSVHTISTWPAVCAGPACVHPALARPDSQFPCCTYVYLFCDILWPEGQSHSDNSHMHVTGLCFACALAQACPTVSCIHLVLILKV